MRGCWEVLHLELKALMRSWSVLLLAIGCVGWTLAVPFVVRGDGTEAGVREIVISYALGGAFVLTMVALVAAATSTLANERLNKRLQLTQIRPVRYFGIVLGKWAAHVIVGALVLALSAVTLALEVDVGVVCRHVMRPVLPSAREEAEAMYATYMADPETPSAVKAAPRSTVLRILEARALDHYQTISTNSSVTWHFAAPGGEAVRLRLTNPMEMRQAVLGRFRSAGREVAISNMTQTVMTIPFAGLGSDLEFQNRGKSALMLRPRKDVEILRVADGFAMNLARAVAMLLTILAVVLAFAVTLSAGLGRPVALFTVMSFLILGLVSPSVVDQYPDEISAGLADRIGLELSRFAASVTSPIATYSPVEQLSRDECVEWRDLLRAATVNLVLTPLVLLFISAFILPRKQDGV